MVTLSRRAVVALAFALVLAPIAAFPLALGRDYPNHLARIYIQANIGSDPALQANYDVVWRIIPHSALDATLWFAGNGQTILGGQIFVAVALGSILLGVLMLHRALYGKTGDGRTSLWPLVAVVALFNLLLEWGFVEYLFSIGLALNTFALWIVSGRRVRLGDDITTTWPAIPRIALFALLSLALFWAHVLGFLLYGLLIVTFEVGRVLDRNPRAWRSALREWGPASLQFVVPLALLAYVAATSESTGNGVILDPGGLRDRVNAVLSPALFYDNWIALVVGGFFVVVIAVGWRMKWLEWDPRMRGPLAGLVIVSALMPVSLIGIWGIHFRYPVVLMLVLIASARVRAPAPAVRGAFVIALLAVVAVQQSNVWSEMRRVDAWHREVQTAVRAMEPGASLLIGAERGTWQDIRHVDALAVIERSAFVPGLFSDVTRVQPSEARRPIDLSGPPLSRAQLTAAAARPPVDPTADASTKSDGWPETFDYLLWIHGGQPAPPPAPNLRRVATGAIADLYAIEPPAPATTEHR